jgi:hypothetical protein
MQIVVLDDEVVDDEAVVVHHALNTVSHLSACIHLQKQFRAIHCTCNVEYKVLLL